MSNSLSSPFPNRYVHLESECRDKNKSQHLEVPSEKGAVQLRLVERNRGRRKAVGVDLLVESTAGLLARLVERLRRGFKWAGESYHGC